MGIKEEIKNVPPSPGIYIMKSAAGEVIYVGKAKNLKNRLRSYFHGSPSLDARKSRMVREVAGFDWVVTENELEALVLEANFIKKEKPRYNIILRDDKNYPYLRLTVQEPWPRLEVARRIVKDGSLYFGPYVPSGGMWEMLRFVRRNFPLISCRFSMERPFRPCVQYQMGRCLAPCAGSRRTAQDRERYMETVAEVKLFLKGEDRALISGIKGRMHDLSEALRFEEAAKLRDRLHAMEKVWEKQRVVSPRIGDADVIGFCRDNGEAAIFLLFIRNGMAVGKKDFFLKRLHGVSTEELFSGFLKQFYSRDMLLPQKVIIPLKGDFKTENRWLAGRKGAPVRISSPAGGKEADLLKMAMDNARFAFQRHITAEDSAIPEETLIEVKDVLGLKTPPERIGAMDVSNTSGTESVGAFVVWEKGKFVKDDYRLFKIRTVKGTDDFSMMGEVAGRHLRNIFEGRGKLPQLLLIDGGRGQLGAVQKAIAPFQLSVEVAAIAKAKKEQMERIFLPERKGSVPLDPYRASTLLLQRIRDEAHRFAVNYHKKLRIKRVLGSPLEKIEGIGKKRRLALLRHFGSIEAIRKASVDEIASLKGMNRKISLLLKERIGGEE